MAKRLPPDQYWRQEVWFSARRCGRAGSGAVRFFESRPVRPRSADSRRCRRQRVNLLPLRVASSTVPSSFSTKLWRPWEEITRALNQTCSFILLSHFALNGCNSDRCVRMGRIESRIQRVRCQRSRIVGEKLHQCTNEGTSVAVAYGKSVGFKLMLAGKRLVSGASGNKKTGTAIEKRIKATPWLAP